VRAALAILVVAAALGVSRSASAYFEDRAVDARSESMGASAAAASRGLAAHYWNPAGLSRLETPELMLDYGKPYGVLGLNTGAVAAGFRAMDTGVALSWHRLAVEEIYAEDVFALALGRSVPIALEGFDLAVGGAVKWERVGLQPFEDRSTGATVAYGSESQVALDAGIQIASPWKLEVGWMVRDLTSPTFQLIEGSAGGDLPRHHELGVAYRWNPESIVAAGWGRSEGTGITTVNLGLEIRFFEVFSIRSGLTNVSNVYHSFDSPDDFQFAGGFGLAHHGWAVDAAAVTHRDLGARYRMTFRTQLPFRSAP
jgi:hypothetical protein